MDILDVLARIVGQDGRDLIPSDFSSIASNSSPNIGVICKSMDCTSAPSPLELNEMLTLMSKTCANRRAPRRGSILAIVHRCHASPGHRIVSTAQNAQRRHHRRRAREEHQVVTNRLGWPHPPSSSSLLSSSRSSSTHPCSPKYFHGYSIFLKIRMRRRGDRHPQKRTRHCGRPRLLFLRVFKQPNIWFFRTDTLVSFFSELSTWTIISTVSVVGLPMLTRSLLANNVSAVNLDLVCQKKGRRVLLVSIIQLPSSYHCHRTCTRSMYVSCPKPEDASKQFLNATWRVR